MTDGPKERNPEQTQRRILDAAEREFTKRGYEGARLREIATSAGVHHALLRHYFRDKEGLFRAVLERSLAAVSSEARDLLRAEGEPQALVAKLAETVVRFAATNRNLILMFHAATLDESSPAFAMCEAVAKDIVVPLLNETARAMRRYQRKGEIRGDLDPKRAVLIALGAGAYAFHEAALARFFLGEDPCAPANLAGHRDAVQRFLMHGLFGEI